MRENSIYTYNAGESYGRLADRLTRQADTHIDFKFSKKENYAIKVATVLLHQYQSDSIGFSVAKWTLKA